MEDLQQMTVSRNELSKEDTERKRLEEDLIESEHRFMAIFNNATDGILLTDVGQSRFFTANNRFCQMLGYTLDEIEYLGFSEIHPDEANPYVAEVFNKQADGKAIQARDIPVKRKDGSLFYADINTTPTQIAGKGYLVGFYRDVTDRKEAEEGIIESEQRFRAIFENATDGILLTDVEKSRFFTANNRFCQMLGYTLDEVENLGAMDIHPEEVHPYVAEVFEKQAQGEFIQAGDILMKRKDGSVFYADINTTPMDIAGRDYLVGIYRDITDRREAQDEVRRQSEFLNTVMKSLTHPFYVIDSADYTIKMANPAAGFGGLSKDSTCYALTHKTDKPCSSEEHPCTLRIIKETKKPVTVEHIHYDLDGDPKFVEVHGFPIFDEEGNVIQIIEYNFDITERKKLEEEHLAAKDRIIEEMERHRVYVFEVADRLRNPLQVQKGLLELIEEEEDLTPDQKTLFNKITKNSMVLEKWIKKLT